MKTTSSLRALLLLSLATAALAQENLTLKDLTAQNAKPLTKAELEALMPGAKMSRLTDKGSTQAWSNDAGGDTTVSNDNRSTNSRMTSTQAKWHISDDGRYCLRIEWRGAPDQSCRFIFKTADGYYGTSALSPATVKALKYSISK